MIGHCAVVPNSTAKSRRRVGSISATLPSKTPALVFPKRALNSGNILLIRVLPQTLALRGSRLPRRCPATMFSYGMRCCAAPYSSRTQEGKNPTEINPVGFLILATSYSRTAYRRTTIGAAAFHCRVRNGNGWGHCAMVTRVRCRTGGTAASQRHGPIPLLW